MSFAPNLQISLRDYTARTPFELSHGRTLEQVLSKYLLAVESAAQTVLLTSILLLDDQKERLWHAAAPSLPSAYCEVINGSEIGPDAGSCGTAAFLGHAIYVTDIATDPLWSNYRHLALPHGLRACWSTPIYVNERELVGTFAVYHLTPRSPTKDEVDAIKMVSAQVAQAIEWARKVGASAGMASIRPDRQSQSLQRGTAETHEVLRSLDRDFQKLAAIMESAMDAFPEADRAVLIRAREAANQGAEAARKFPKSH